MTKSMVLIGLAILVPAGISFAAAGDQPASASAAGPGQICEMVVDNKPGSKPYKMCMTKPEWEAKKIADAKDATRIVCHYEEMPGTRFRSAKVCMTAAEWWNQRQADRQAVERIQMQTCVPGAGC